jgi:hypothetical protein
MSAAEPVFVDVFVEANEICPTACTLRWRAESEPREVTRLRYWVDSDEAVVCRITGWSSAGGGTPCPARWVVVEDSSSGSARLVWGGDWGLKLVPEDGSEPFGEPYLLAAPEDLLP